MENTKKPLRKIIDFADKDFVSLDENTLVAEAARIMYERDVCSVIVTHNDSERLLRRSVGMITARDFLHRVVAQSYIIFLASHVFLPHL
ncbi:MAG: CBS domain-containing protein [Nitrososphaera sp.]|nr:CBS domain-containing protein [Nitrososphaera sp.]